MDDIFDPQATSDSFWDYLDQLVSSSSIIIDRKRHTSHPLYPEIIYPLDYGYLKDTIAMDGGGIDIWQGSTNSHEITAVILTIDLKKRDAEIKILLGCTNEEMQVIFDFHKKNGMRGLLVPRLIN